MSLRPKLRQTPLLFELIPPHRRASPKVVQRFLARFVRPAADALPLDAFNIPEIVDENFRGEPLYRTLDPREVGREARSAGGKEECVVSKIAVHCRRGADELQEWATETREEYGIENVVVVGAYLPDVDYPGPGVPEATALLKEAGMTCGNIMIPERPGEAAKMLEKSRAGADFFTTQAVFNGDRFVEVQEGYYARCEAEGLAPAAIVASFTPVTEAYDLEFLRWLGVDIPTEMERQLLSPTGDPAAPSIALAVENWKKMREAAERHSGAPLGLNVEYISRHNFGATLELGRRLREGG